MLLYHGCELFPMWPYHLPAGPTPIKDTSLITPLWNNLILPVVCVSWKAAIPLEALFSVTFDLRCCLSTSVIMFCCKQSVIIFVWGVAYLLPCRSVWGSEPGRGDVMMAITYNAGASCRCTQPSLQRYDLSAVHRRHICSRDLVSRMHVWSDARHDTPTWNSRFVIRPINML